MSTESLSRDPKIGLVEKFYSVQGEGFNAGRAALFIRFAGCNLDCRFADGARCDTPWERAQEKITMRELTEWITKFLHPAPVRPMVILTGGEPTMSPFFGRVVDLCTELNLYTAVETNGTIYTPGLELINWIVVSPKTTIAQGAPLGSSEVDGRVMLMADEMRYVITGPDDPIPPINEEAFFHYVSPALEADGTGLEAARGITPGFVPGALERCVEIVKEDPNWRISLQTHKWMKVR